MPTGWRRAAGAVPRSLWVFADQGIVSLANFAAPVLVGRYAGQEQLGVFVIGFSVYLVMLGLVHSLVWTAYTRRAQQLTAEQQPRFAGSATVHLLTALAVACVVLWLVALVAAVLGVGWLASLMAIVAPASAVMLLREHVRRLCLARLAFFEAFLFDLIVAISQCVLLGWLVVTGRINALSAFACLAAAALLSVIWFARRQETWRLDWQAVLPDWRRLWADSKWLVGGGASVLLGNQGYRWLLAALYGLVEVGRLGAASVLVQITNPLVLGAANYLGPTSAAIHQSDGVRGLWKYTLRVTLVMTGLIGLFLIGVALVGEAVVTAILREGAEGVGATLLLTLSAGALSEAMLKPIEFASLNCGRARLMFKTAVVRLAVNCSLGFGLVGWLGAEAIGIGMLLGSSIAFAWQWAALAAEVRRA